MKHVTPPPFHLVTFRGLVHALPVPTGEGSVTLTVCGARPTKSARVAVGTTTDASRISCQACRLKLTRSVEE